MRLSALRTGRRLRQQSWQRPSTRRVGEVLSARSPFRRALSAPGVAVRAMRAASAVYAGQYGTKRKETTAGPGVNLYYNGTTNPSTWSGGWDY